MISIIVAVSENGVIGKENRLIWRLPADLSRFKQLTMGHHMLMGRKTFESIGRVLPGRTTVIISRNAHYRKEGCLVAPSLESALALCRQDPEVFIIGGGELYRQALPLADRVYLTRLHHDFDGDTCFPRLEDTAWRRVSTERFNADSQNPYDYSFIVLDRIKKA